MIEVRYNDFIFDNLRVECGYNDRTITEFEYWNAVTKTLSLYGAIIRGKHDIDYSTVVKFETEQDYMFFKLRYG